MMTTKEKPAILWEDRFCEIYFSSLYDENQRVKELMFMVDRDRKEIIRDILKRINEMPVPQNLTEQQKKLLDYIKKWMSDIYIPRIIKDYFFKSIPETKSV